MSDVRTFYCYPKVGPGRAAIAIEETELPGWGRYARVGYAFCSPKDQFVRKRGRQMAQGRLDKGGSNYFEIDVPSELTRKEALDFVVSMVVACAPQWADR